ELLPLDTVRNQLLAIYQEDLQTSEFDEAAQLARQLQPLFPPQRELELTGSLLRAAAASYLAKAETAAPDQRKILAAKGRANLRRAGLAFARLAEANIPNRAYTDDLWNSAECYLQGRDYTHAAESLELYLKYELRARRATALVRLAEARLALHEIDKALPALQECIDA